VKIVRDKNGLQSFFNFFVGKEIADKKTITQGSAP